MTKGEARLRQDRAARARAKSALDNQLEQVKADLAAKGVAARAGQAAIDQTSEAVEIGLDVARERKGVIAGTIGALLLWLLRKPIIHGVSGAAARMRGDEAAEDDETETEEREREQVH
jgi:hypothetical protein